MVDFIFIGVIFAFSILNLALAVRAEEKWGKQAEVLLKFHLSCFLYSMCIAIGLLFGLLFSIM